MSQRFIRCVHCGLPHQAQLEQCPTTGLAIEAIPNRSLGRSPAGGNASGVGQQDSAEPSGSLIDERFRIVKPIGEGGMSTVYEAEVLSTGKQVAVKVLHPALVKDADAVARLKREAEIVGALAHPNICGILELGQTREGAPYLVMDRLYGETLATRLKRVGALQFDELASILRQVLAALEITHQHGILHRDLKPENIFVLDASAGQQLVVKLLDFGVSKSIVLDDSKEQRLTHTGMVMGTPYYMAPEQARGAVDLDAGVDLWAVGVILYECLSGYRPFMANNYNALLVKVLSCEPRPIRHFFPEMPTVVGELLDRALAKDRRVRFRNAREFAIALEQTQRFCEDFHTTPPQWQSGMHRRAPGTAPQGVVGAELASRMAVADADTVVTPTSAEAVFGEAKHQAAACGADAVLWDDLAEPTIEDRASNHDYGRKKLPARSATSGERSVPEDDDTKIMVRKASMTARRGATRNVALVDKPPGETELAAGPPALASRRPVRREPVVIAKQGVDPVTEEDQSIDVGDEQQD